MGFSMISLFLVLNILFQVHLRADASSSPEVGKHAVPAPNIALNGISTQSSTQAYYGRPRNANDGSIANNYLRSQCSYTEKELDPWWMVDLRKSYKIFSVAVTNRVLECCKERLYGAEIRIGNDPTQGGRLNPRCGVISTIESGETISFSCHGMIGKYVTVTIPGREEHLVLCEVQVFGVLATPSDVQPSEEELKTTLNGAPNVAVHGISSQSSLYNMYGVSKNAIDGSLSSNYLFIECTGTAEQDNPWWMVDLQVKHKIFTVAVTNRGDCCADRINGAQIRIGNSAENGGADNTICGVIEKMDHGQTLAFECAGMEGQYVTVNLPASNQSLFICEVQVFGVPTEVTEEQVPSTKSTGIDFSWLDFFGRLDDYFDSSSKEDIPDEQEEEEQGINLAFRGVSSQSSTYDKFGAAANAIDGSSGNKYMSGHCSHTDLDIEPWWRVDLTNTYNITKVKIMNRGDCCNERIKGAEIRIGLSQEKGGTRNPRCATIESLGLGKEIEFICGMVGRYVTVTIPDKAAYLTLCEVKIYGDEISENYTIPHFPYDSEEHHEATELRNILKHSNAAPNVALQGVTYQSSIDGECDSRRAADGCLKNLLPDDQCARTKEEMDPWWTVDLKSDHKVFSIAVTSRGDCCEHDLDGAEIHVGNSATGWKKNPVCGTVSSIGPGETFSFNCDGMEGRFVTIVIPQKAKSLTLCEVQVFGVPVDAISAEWTGNLDLQKEHHGAKNVAPAGIPSQSSYFSRKSEVMTAIDGSLSSNYMAGECAHTLKQFNPWWRLDLKSKMRVHSVAITNRGDCCRERINGAEVRIGDSEADGGIKNPRCGVVYKMNYGETLSFNCKGMEGQYVTITIPDNREFLTLCEVQVFADPTEAAEEKSSEPVQISESSLKLNITNDLSGNYFYFPEENDNSYVYLSPKIPMDLKALTLCMKISPNINDNRETILFSYRTTYYDELNLWIESSGNIGLYMSGEGIMFSPLNHKKEWAHLCLTWESKYGRCELWLNGRRKGPRIYRRSHSIRPGGIVLLGQDQDSLGGNFEAAQSYVGKIKDLNMWDKVLSLRALRSVFKNKQVQAGTVFDWRSLNYMIKGNVTVV
ncbi:uncharacterized protein LOC128499816 [Spea bombifrons]|uniref:uncharacterized protein LOC128499816 n=1 Tax=Spea bombifrons TaxID=233779 RepID=UPI002349A5AF|nr:uncharacterized protein LOC128499816 [Spea bombifrons]